MSNDGWQTVGIVAAIVIGGAGLGFSIFQEVRTPKESIVELSVSARTATLTREVHELHAADPSTGITEPLWEWYVDDTLIFDVEIENIRTRGVTISNVSVYNDADQRIGFKAFSGENGRILQAGNLIVSDINLDLEKLDPTLTARACSRVLDDATSCRTDDDTRFPGTIKVKAVVGEANVNFILTTVRSVVRACVIEDLQQDVEPSEGCPILEGAIGDPPAQ